MSEQYPEHEKLLALRCPGKPEEPYASHNHLIGEFLEWLRDEGFEVTWWDQESEKYLYTHHDVQFYIAGFFGIDQDKLEAEKRQMLDDIRAVNGRRSRSS